MNRRYVNMTDVNFSSPSADPDSRPAEGRSAGPRADNLRWDIIELLFFAYRDFVGDADHELEAKNSNSMKSQRKSPVRRLPSAPFESGSPGPF